MLEIRIQSAAKFFVQETIQVVVIFVILQIGCREERMENSSSAVQLSALVDTSFGRSFYDAWVSLGINRFGSFKSESIKTSTDTPAALA